MSNPIPKSVLTCADRIAAQHKSLTPAQCLEKAWAWYRSKQEQQAASAAARVVPERETIEWHRREVARLERLVENLEGRLAKYEQPSQHTLESKFAI